MALMENFILKKGRMIMKTPEEMLELCEKATAGPWEMRMSSPVRITKDNNIIFALLFDETENIGNNAQFIAESREFVPWAAERIIELEKILKQTLDYHDQLAKILPMKIESEIRQVLGE
jgi:hypothetical protein